MLTVKDAASQLKISEVRVRQLIAAGYLEARKVGRSWLIEERDVVDRELSKPRSGRRTETEAPKFQQLDVNEIKGLYKSCKDNLSACPTVQELCSLDSEEAAFRVAIHEFFLRQKQAELVRQGVF